MKPRTDRCLLAAAFLSVLAPAPALAAPKDEAKVFVGYVFGPPRAINFRLYTHLCHAFLVADAEGRIRPSKQVPNPDLARDAHAAGVKVLVSLGGWGWDEQFAAIVARPEAEDRYVRSVLEVVDRGDYDGVDLDWEYPDTAGEVAGFERLARRFRKDLDALGVTKGRAMVQTMAASSNPGTLRWLARDFLVETMDWVNVMTYDFAGDWTDYAGHNSPLFASSKQPGSTPRSTEASMKYLVEERGMPANKLAVGIPLYGRGFPVAEPYQSTKGVAKVRMPGGDFANLARLERDEHWTRRWDDQTKTPWLIAPDARMVFGYDDAESVALKTDWALARGFRGVFFWQVAADRLPDGTNPLQEASKLRWDRPSKGDAR